MSRPYGKFPRRYPAAKARRAAGAPGRQARIRFKGRYDLEQATLLFLRLIALLQDAEIERIEDCVIYLTPLGRDEERKVFGAVCDGQETMDLFLPVAAKFTAAARR